MDDDKSKFTADNNCHSVKCGTNISLNEKLPMSNLVKEEIISYFDNEDSDQSFHIDNTEKINREDLITNININEVKIEKNDIFVQLDSFINSIKIETEDLDDDDEFETHDTVSKEDLSSDKFQFKLEYEDKTIKIEKEMIEDDVLESVIVIEKNGINSILNEDKYNDVSDSKVADSPETFFNEIVNSNGKTFKNNSNCKKRCYICDLCQHMFYRKNLLISHIKRHYSKTILSSVFVKNVMPKKIKLKLLKQFCPGKNSYECLVCCKNFSDQSNCNRHIKNHFHSVDNLNHFECHICMKTFNREYNLRVHCRTHTGENPYKCDVCQLSFYRKDMMQSHRRIHGTKYADLHCNKCKKPFNSLSTLKRHKMIHKNVKPYTCDNCNKVYTRKDSLVVHIRSKHTGERPYKCNICNKSYFENSVLIRHKKSTH